MSIPHLFARKEDIEIAGFLSATLAWGQRKTIIRNATRLVQLMDMAPHDFILHFKKKDLEAFEKFVHRTFNGTDCAYFLLSLKRIYEKCGGLENAFCGGKKYEEENVRKAIIDFRKEFFILNGQMRTRKHVSDPEKNSSAKRLCMFLRWMVRNDKQGVDFGIWKKIAPSQLCLPLDVHTGKVSRALGLLARKQDDWKAVAEITGQLKKFDPTDPVKYDFALFGMGVNGEIVNR